MGSLISVWAYKTTVVNNLLPGYSSARIQHCRRLHQESIFNGLPSPELKFYSDEVWLILSGYINSQNKKCWNTDNPHAIHELSLLDLKVGGWCPISSRRIIGTVLFREQYIPIDCQPPPMCWLMDILRNIMQRHTLERILWNHGTSHWTSHKKRIVASTITLFKSLWL